MSVTYNEAGLRVLIGNKSIDELNRPLVESDLECPIMLHVLLGKTNDGDYSPFYSVVAGSFYSKHAIDELKKRSIRSIYENTIQVGGRKRDFPSKLFFSPQVAALAKRRALQLKYESGSNAPVFSNMRFVEILPFAIIDRFASARMFDDDFVIRKDGRIAFSFHEQPGDTRLEKRTRELALQRLQSEWKTESLTDTYLHHIVVLNYEGVNPKIPPHRSLNVRRTNVFKKSRIVQGKSSIFSQLVSAFWSIVFFGVDLFTGRFFGKLFSRQA